MRQGSRAAKRIFQRGSRHNFKEFASWIGAEGTAEGVGVAGAAGVEAGEADLVGSVVVVAC